MTANIVPSVPSSLGPKLQLGAALPRSSASPATKPGFSRPLHGFTLVELLVVVTIIGMLLALLIPAVLHVREAARLAQCTNNLKEIGTYTHVYRNSGDGAFPTPGQLGRHTFRVAPGKVSPPGDPRGLKEVYGLQAFFEGHRIINGQRIKLPGLMGEGGEEWICPSQDYFYGNSMYQCSMKDLGNTYAFSIARMYAEKLEFTGISRHWWVWDNYFMLPATSGWRGPFGPGFALPREEREKAYPHATWGGRGRNVLFLDGHVEYKAFRQGYVPKDDPANPENPDNK